jgi:integrase
MAISEDRTWPPARTSRWPLTIDQGADPKLIQTQLGHSSISITYDIYGHLFPDRLDELAYKLDELIRKGRPGRDQDRSTGRTL